MESTKYSHLLNDEKVMDGLAEFVDELERAEAKHPVWPKDQFKQTGIVMGEASEAFTDSIHLSEGRSGADLKKVRSEIIQVGAMCLRWLKNYKDEQ